MSRSRSWFEYCCEFMFEKYNQPFFFGFAGILAVIYLSSFVSLLNKMGSEIHTPFDAVKLIVGIGVILYVWATLTETAHKAFGITDAKEEAKATERQLAAEELQAKQNRLNGLELDLNAYYDGQVVYRHK